MKFEQIALREKEDRASDTETIVGPVEMIRTQKNGTTIVTVKSHETGKTKEFRHPRDMTDKQLAEFKRAQDHDHWTSVEWSEANGKHTIEELTVIRNQTK